MKLSKCIWKQWEYKKKNKQRKIVLLAMSKLNTTEKRIFKVLNNIEIRDGKFILVGNGAEIVGLRIASEENTVNEVAVKETV